MAAEHDIHTVEELRAVLPVPPAGEAKVMHSIDPHCRRFIELSPFLVIASRNAAGQMDVSPKGDPPGFVRILDEHTIAIPERPGNHRCDTFTNVLEVPEVALIFLVPGQDPTLRVMGRATITRDPELLESMAVHGKVPVLALRIAVDDAFIHCGKAPKRGGLWHADAQAPKDAFPRLGEMIHDQIAWKTGLELPISREELGDSIDEDHRSNVY